MMDFERFVLRIIFAKRQLSIFSIMVGSAFLVLLFFLFFKTFTKYYIQELKLMYPSYYLVKNKTLDHYKIKGFDTSSEIFELNSDGFTISFNKQDHYTLGSVGIRSFPTQHIPSLLSKEPNFQYSDLNNTIFLSSRIYKELSARKNFQGVLYLKSDINGQVHKFFAKEFTLHENTKWVLFANPAAQKIYTDTLFNKVAFYPHNTTMSDDEVVEVLHSHFDNIIYRWDERISLISRALKESMLLVFSWTTVAIIILTTMSILFFARELIDDLIHLTQYAFFYSLSFSRVYISYLLIMNILLMLLLFLAYYLAYTANAFLVQTLWSVEPYQQTSFLIYIGFIFACISSVGLYVQLQKLYSFHRGLMSV